MRSPELWGSLILSSLFHWPVLSDSFDRSVTSAWEKKVGFCIRGNWLSSFGRFYCLRVRAISQTRVLTPWLIGFLSWALKEIPALQSDPLRSKVLFRELDNGNASLTLDQARELDFRPSKGTRGSCRATITETVTVWLTTRNSTSSSVVQVQWPETVQRSMAPTISQRIHGKEIDSKSSFP